MGQDIFSPPSVFNYYQPDFRIMVNGQPVVAPPAQLLTTLTIIQRLNLLNDFLFASPFNPAAIRIRPGAPTCSTSYSAQTSTGRWSSNVAGARSSSRTGPNVSLSTTCSASNRTRASASRRTGHGDVRHRPSHRWPAHRADQGRGVHRARSGPALARPGPKGAGERGGAVEADRHGDLDDRAARDGELGHGPLQPGVLDEGPPRLADLLRETAAECALGDADGGAHRSRRHLTEVGEGVCDHGGHHVVAVGQGERQRRGVGQLLANDPGQSGEERPGLVVVGGPVNRPPCGVADHLPEHRRHGQDRQAVPGQVEGVRVEEDGDGGDVLQGRGVGLAGRDPRRVPGSEHVLAGAAPQRRHP